MGNTESTLRVASANASINNLYLFVPNSSQPVGVQLTSASDLRTIFRFQNDQSQRGVFYTRFNNPVQQGVLDLNLAQQLVMFSGNGASGNREKLLQCYGDDSSRMINCYNSTVGGRPLNQFYSCDRGNGASLQIGTGVPSGCAFLNLVYTPRA